MDLTVNQWTYGFVIHESSLYEPSHAVNVRLQISEHLGWEFSVRGAVHSRLTQNNYYIITAPVIVVLQGSILSFKGFQKG